MWGRVPPDVSRPLEVKLCIGPNRFSRCKYTLEVLQHHAKFGEAPISPTAGAAKNVEFFLSACFSDCLFVCPSRFSASEILRAILP